MEKSCERCGSAYEAKDSRGRWCPVCRPVAQREAESSKRRRGGPVRLVCADCNAAFDALRIDAFRCPDCRAKDQKRRSADYELRRKFPCPDCGRDIARKAGKCRSCAQKGRSGPLSPSWKGGRTRHADGYIELNIDGKYVLEHRYVWEQAHGPTPSHIHIHHANGDKTDNRLENLVATDAKGHRHRERMVDPYAEKVRQLEARIRELEAQIEEDGSPPQETVYDLPGPA